jgi:hypothetical protein
MSKVTMPCLSIKAAGRVDQSIASFLHGTSDHRIYRRQGNMVLLERYYAPFNPQTSLQQEGRSAFKDAVSGWQALSAGEKASWNYYQDYRRQRPPMSGYNL